MAANPNGDSGDPQVPERPWFAIRFVAPGSVLFEMQQSSECPPTPAQLGVVAAFLDEINRDAYRQMFAQQRQGPRVVVPHGILKG